MTRHISSSQNSYPRLEGEFWGPTVDLLLDENVKEREQLPLQYP
jgi:hypothetical protein